MRTIYFLEVDHKRYVCSYLIEITGFALFMGALGQVEEIPTDDEGEVPLSRING